MVVFIFFSFSTCKFWFYLINPPAIYSLKPVGFLVFLLLQIQLSIQKKILLVKVEHFFHTQSKLRLLVTIDKEFDSVHNLLLIAVPGKYGI